MDIHELQQRVEAQEKALEAIIVAFAMVKTDSPAVAALKSSLRDAPNGLKDGAGKDMLRRFHALL